MGAWIASITDKFHMRLCKKAFGQQASGHFTTSHRLTSRFYGIILHTPAYINVSLSRVSNETLQRLPGTGDEGRVS